MCRSTRGPLHKNLHNACFRRVVIHDTSPRPMMHCATHCWHLVEKIAINCYRKDSEHLSMSLSRSIFSLALRCMPTILFNKDCQWPIRAYELFKSVRVARNWDDRPRGNHRELSNTPEVEQTTEGLLQTQVEGTWLFIYPAWQSALGSVDAGVAMALFSCNQLFGVYIIE